MAWFRRGNKAQGSAVVTPMSGAAGAVRLERKGNKPTVAAFAWHDQATTRARDMTQLAQEVGAGNHPLIALLGNEHYQTVLMEAPSVPDEELSSAMRWKVKELINFHIDDAVLDYLPVPGGGGRGPSLYVVAAQSQAVRDLAKLYTDENLGLSVINVRECAQHNLATLLAPPEYAIALLHVDQDGGLLTFSYGEDLILSRRIDAMGASGEYLADKVAMEAQRSVDYFERQYSWFPLAKLYLAPMPDLSEMRTKLQEYLPIGVEALDMANLFDLSAIPALADPQRQNAAFHLLGAALGGERP